MPPVLLALDRAREDLQLAKKSPESSEPLSSPSRLHCSYPDSSSRARVIEPHSVVISDHRTHDGQSALTLKRGAILLKEPISSSVTAVSDLCLSA